MLPTGGTARFFSPLSTDSFMKKSSLIFYTREALDKVGEAISRSPTWRGSKRTETRSE